MKMSDDLLSVKDAADWASNYMKKDISPSNISYLVQYAKIKKYNDNSNNIQVNINELQKYYDKIREKEQKWKDKLGEDLNWGISFDQFKESETTKHVHRLHPYKGKFIPQLVEYFLDGHVNTFKKEVFFNKGDIVLDPFMGSGTTLIQAAELGIHSIGIDISEFNCLIAKVKSDDYSLFELKYVLDGAYRKTMKFSNETFDNNFEIELKKRLSEFNSKFFPNPEFKHQVKGDRTFEQEYSEEKFQQFLKDNHEFLTCNGTRDKTHLFDEGVMSNFITRWYNKRIRQELYFYLKLIDAERNEQTKNIMRIILSRTVRSCRATTHYDLATLKERQIGPYYCFKHYKICTPIDSILKHLKHYTEDTVQRLDEFSILKKSVNIGIIHGDSRNVDIFKEIKRQSPNFYKMLTKKKIAGIFTSPPYVGQIDYHEQHAYAYEMFNITRRDDDEIGPMSKGTGKLAKEKYVQDISDVLNNVGKYVKKEGYFFIVANDKHNLYPKIAEKSGLKITDEYKRPVLNRTERDRQPYAEIIFQMEKE
jgi:DNA modification methylase